MIPNRLAILQLPQGRDLGTWWEVAVRAGTSWSSGVRTHGVGGIPCSGVASPEGRMYLPVEREDGFSSFACTVTRPERLGSLFERSRSRIDFLGGWGRLHDCVQALFPSSPSTSRDGLVDRRVTWLGAPDAFRRSQPGRTKSRGSPRQARRATGAVRDIRVPNASPFLPPSQFGGRNMRLADASYSARDPQRCLFGCLRRFLRAAPTRALTGFLSACSSAAGPPSHRLSPVARQDPRRCY